MMYNNYFVITTDVLLNIEMKIIIIASYNVFFLNLIWTNYRVVETLECFKFMVCLLTDAIGMRGLSIQLYRIYPANVTVLSITEFIEQLF